MSGTGADAAVAAFAGELERLSEHVARLSELSEAAFEGAHLIPEFLRVDLEDVRAAGAVKLRIRLQPTERLGLLVAALRAGNANLDLIVAELGHLTCPVGSPSDSRALPGESRDARPVGEEPRP
jgi:hypothetical protein